MSIPLSRLLITENIDENIPNCVIYEIAEAHLIKINNTDNIKEIINTINKLSIINVNKPYKSEDYRKIASFVNCHTTWKIKPLIESFEFLIKFYDKESIMTLPDSNNFKYGLQTPEYPYSYNACVLYKYCKYLNIPINNKTNIHDMWISILCFTYSEQNLKNITINLISNYNKLQLYQLIYNITKNDNINLENILVDQKKK